MVKSLPQHEIEGWIATHPRWRFREGAISKKYTFPSFRSAIVFVNRVATIADELDHHPDISVKYNEVWLTVSTHDVGGITEKDFKLAERIDFATSAR